jgi:hypothetical protein
LLINSLTLKMWNLTHDLPRVASGTRESADDDTAQKKLSDIAKDSALQMGLFHIELVGLMRDELDIRSA